MIDFNDDDFEELAPRAKATVSSPVAFGTCCVRGGTEKVTLTFAPEAIARLDGWPRFAVAWSPKQMALRIRADAQGRFEACRTPLGGRYMLRVDLPRELIHVPKLREPAPHRYGEAGGDPLRDRAPGLPRPAPAGAPGAPGAQGARPGEPPSGGPGGAGRRPRPGDQGRLPWVIPGRPRSTCSPSPSG